MRRPAGFRRHASGQSLARIALHLHGEVGHGLGDEGQQQDADVLALAALILPSTVGAVRRVRGLGDAE